MDIVASADNWNVIQRFLPAGWQGRAKELGALRRQRNFRDASMLLRVLLMHLADGCSLRETAARAMQAGWGEFSDVALLKRLRTASEWFRWMGLELLARRLGRVERPSWLAGRRLRSVDATVVCEPGSTGTDWRFHYSQELFELRCDYFKLTGPEVGETFTNYPVRKGDILIGDRAYASLEGLCHVRDHGGDFVVRLRNKAFRFRQVGEECEFDLLSALRKLSFGQTGEWRVSARGGSSRRSIRMRVCGIKKSPEAAEKAVQRALRKARDKGRTVTPETLELHRYVVVVTSLAKDEATTEQVLELYRLRWQIEIAFKRLKSIVGLGHLPKQDPASARAWLHGKMLVALIVQAIVDEGRLFSPWGYPLG
jgi:hypothetical protein